MTTRATTTADEDPGSTRRRVTRAVLTSILAGGVGPYIVYALLHERAGEVQALLLGGLLPGVLEVVTLVRHRRLDPLGIVSLAALLLGVVLATTSGSPRALLLKESAVTGVVGLGFLLSLLAERPALFYFARQLMTGDVPAKAKAFDERWDASPGMRATLRRLTTGWGAGLLIELVVRIALVLSLPTERVLVVGPVALYAALFVLIAWTVRTTRRAEAAKATKVP